MKMIRNIGFLLLAATGISGMLTSCKSSDTKSADTAAQSASRDGAVDLKLNFKPGEKFLYTTSIDQKIETITAMNQKVLIDMIYAGEGEEGGDKRLSITYDRIKMDITSAMMNMSYDSKDPAKQESSMSAAGSLIGKTFSIVVAPDGQIKKVEGLAALMNDVGKSGKGADAAAMFSDSSVMQMMQSSFDLYPGRPVKVGDSWKKTTKTAFGPMKVNVENNYTLKSVNGDKAVIALSSVMSLPKSEVGPAGNGAQMEMNGTQEGTLDVSVATGQIISGKTIQDIKGTMTVPGMGQPMPLNIKGNIDVASKKL